MIIGPEIYDIDGNLDWFESWKQGGDATIVGAGDIKGDFMVISCFSIGTDLVFPDVWVVKDNLFVHAWAPGFAGKMDASLIDPGDRPPLNQTHHPNGILIINGIFGLNNQVDFSAFTVFAAQQEKIEQLMAASAQAEFFQKPPLWIEFLWDEEEEEIEEEECDPGDEDCWERKRQREQEMEESTTSWLWDLNLSPHNPTLLQEHKEVESRIQLSSLRVI
jgi:hypothetical protein